MAEVTIYTLAKELGMTPSMVSRAFNPDGKISEEKRKCVLAAAQKHNFYPNKFASRLSMKPIRIGVVIRGKFQINIDKMIEGIRISHNQLKDYKIEYDITVHSSASSDEEISKTLNTYKDYDGVILTGMSSSKYTLMITDLYEKNHNIVQVQSINKEVSSLFCSKHNESVASGLAADFLSNCLKKSRRKNILLFTGDFANTVHSNARAAFKSSCEANGMTLLDVIDMKDNDEYLESIVPDIFSKYENEIDGIYITSGISTPLCKYLHSHNLDFPFVAFDTHPDIKYFMEKGVIGAAISQDVTNQMSVAFEALVKHIMTGEEYPPILYTDVNIMLKSNMHQFN